MAQPATTHAGVEQIERVEQRAHALNEAIRATHAERWRNRQFFEARRDQLLAAHPEDWLLIHSGGQVIASNDRSRLNELREALAPTQRGAALIQRRRFRDETDAIFEEHQRNLDFFLAHQDELFEKHSHMWLLIHSGGQVVASKDLLDLHDLRRTFDDVTRKGALIEIERPWPMISTPFVIR